MESGSLQHCKDELELYGKIEENKKKDILELVELVCNQGHSGFSIGFVLSILNKESLDNFDPIIITDDEYGMMVQRDRADVIEKIKSLKLEEYVDIIKTLIGYGNLTPLTFSDNEFKDNDCGGSRQNKRCSAIFKDKDNKPYYLDGIVFQTLKHYIDEDGEHHAYWSRFTGCCDVVMPDGTLKIVRSSTYFKNGNKIPKTFYITVAEEEPKPDWFEHYARYEDLKEVMEYYDVRFKERS